MKDSRLQAMNLKEVWGKGVWQGLVEGKQRERSLNYNLKYGVEGASAPP